MWLFLTVILVAYFCTVCSVFETSLPRELPIVHEITTVLREWHHLWKELYLVSLLIYLLLVGYSACLQGNWSCHSSSLTLFQFLYVLIREAGLLICPWRHETMFSCKVKNILVWSTTLTLVAAVYFFLPANTIDNPMLRNITTVKATFSITIFIHDNKIPQRNRHHSQLTKYVHDSR